MKRIEINKSNKGNVVDVIETKTVKRRYTQEFLDKQIQATKVSIIKLQDRLDELMQLRSHYD